MTDMHEICETGRQILHTLGELRRPTAREDLFDHFSKAKIITAMISQIDLTNPSNLEPFIARITVCITKATLKTQNIVGNSESDDFHTILTHKDSKKAEENSESRDESRFELSKACFAFVHKIDVLLKKIYESNDRQDQKQNNNGQYRLDDQIWQAFVRILNEFKKEICRPREIHQKNGMKQINKIYCESEGGQRHINSNSNSNSSCRSLLTEKLKNITVIDNDEEQGLYCVQDKIVIKGNWILREMKGNRNEKGSQPRQLLNFQEESYRANVYSLGIPNIHKRGQKTEAPTKRAILEEMRPFRESKKEIKAKRKESGCARCQIY